MRYKIAKGHHSLLSILVLRLENSSALKNKNSLNLLINHNISTVNMMHVESYCNEKPRRIYGSNRGKHTPAIREQLCRHTKNSRIKYFLKILQKPRDSLERRDEAGSAAQGAGGLVQFIQAVRQPLLAKPSLLGPEKVSQELTL
jgi:hypothetical protein